jgi:hypothetical protein
MLMGGCLAPPEIEITAGNVQDVQSSATWYKPEEWFVPSSYLDALSFEGSTWSFRYLLPNVAGIETPVDPDNLNIVAFGEGPGLFLGQGNAPSVAFWEETCVLVRTENANTIVVLVTLTSRVPYFYVMVPGVYQVTYYKDVTVETDDQYIRIRLPLPSSDRPGEYFIQLRIDELPPDMSETIQYVQDTFGAALDRAIREAEE